MIESVITLSLIGFAAGFLLSVPVAGPIAAMVVSEALRGNLRKAARVAIGSSFVEFFYVFLGMFGITYLLKFYQPFIPYLFLAGGVLIFFVSIKIFKQKFDIGDKTEEEKSGGFRMGASANIGNPSLFFSWLTTSFIILSFASSIGLNTGGLDVILEKNVSEISQYADANIKQLEENKFILKKNEENKIGKEKNQIKPEHAVILSFFYAFAVSFGSFAWFFFFSRFINKHKSKINTVFINYALKVISVFLFFLAGYFIYLGAKIIINLG